MTATILTSTAHTSKFSRVGLAAALLVGAATLSATEAGAVSGAVKAACLGDYLSYCSAHGVDTPQLRRCMSAAGPKLSRGCISALIRAGEVSKAEVNRRAAALR